MNPIDGRNQGRAAAEVVEALAALFDDLAPDERAEAEEELRDGGLDPAAVARRFKGEAETALGIRQPLLLREAGRELAAASGRRGPDAPSARSRRATPTSLKWIAAVAATFIVFSLGYAVGRNQAGSPPPFRLSVPLPRAMERNAPGRTHGGVQAALSGEASPHLQPPAATPPAAATPAAATPAAAAPAADRRIEHAPGVGDGSHRLDASVPAQPAMPQLHDVSPRAGALPEGIEAGASITKANAAAVNDLVSPGVAWCLQHGMKMRIVRYRKVQWNTAYREATERYAGQVRLATDGRSLEGYVAGMPFPNVDANDPQAALKLMWNYEYKPYITDDEDLRNFDADSGPIAADAPMTIERHFLLDHLRTLRYEGRIYVAPKPELSNPDKVRGKSSLHPVLEPFDLKGVGVTSVRYMNPDRQDDTWLYLPSLRRVRRLSSAQRSDALFGQDADVDSAGGFAGQIPWFDWKLLGEKEVLESFHADAFPVKYCEGAGDFIFCDNWERRKVYVLEGVPKLPQYAYGKRIIFLDKETFLIGYSDIYDRSGELRKVWVNQWSFKKRATDFYGIEYPDEMPFRPSITMVDTQRNHATRAALPSPKFPGEEGWYFNQGEKSGTTEDFFTIAHLVESGH